MARESINESSAPEADNGRHFLDWLTDGRTHLGRAWQRDTQRLQGLAREIAQLPSAQQFQRLNAMEQWERLEVLSEIRHKHG